MSTKKNTGVRNHNTNMAPTQAGSGVTVIPSADPVASTPTAGTTPAAPITAPHARQLYLGVAAIKTFRERYDAALAELETALGIFPNPEKARAVFVSAR